LRVLIPASSLLVAPALVSTGPSQQTRTLSYPAHEVCRPSFGGPLNPDHSRRVSAGRVSYYALFKGMAASKPTSSLSRQKHILRYTQRPLRGLSCGSGFFPSRRWTLSPSDCLPRSIGQAFGVWLGLVGATLPRAHPVALPPADIRPYGQPRGSTSIDFGENQLSPGLIGLSPLPTSHPNGFQPIPVRASTGCYPSFTLLMGRSPWLRVYPLELHTPSLQDSLSLWLRW
jgi:hypothetical protein